MCSRVPLASGLSKPISSPQTSGGLFGYGVALVGDTLAVGAPFEASNATGVNGNQTDTSAPRAGAVYVFTRTAGIWSQQAYLKASNTDAGDRFGHDLQIDGETLAVGARFEASAASGVNADQTDNSAPNAGAVYVFTRTAGIWSQQAYLKASNAGANKNFSGSSQSREISWPWVHGSRIAMRPGSMAIKGTVTRLTAVRSIYSSGAPGCGHRHTI